ncbi:MAG: DUF87 domain-containing protein, partial [Candidatus Diapherotrites archaeon]|nr:DUF87 domain-containing protein [Candidatus Diapherotrites archaeon]
MTLGTVISTQDSPSTTKLFFVVDENQNVNKGQFIQTDGPDGSVIGLVTDLVKTNRYFENADSVKTFESSGHNIIDQLPTKEWEYLVAEVKPLGVYKSNLLSRMSHPVSPGAKVSQAEEETLKKFLGLDYSDGLTIGTLEHHALDIKLNMSRLLQKHLAILAMSGSGKSVTSTVLMEELLERTRTQGRLSTIVVDVHGEYGSLAQPPKDTTCKDYSAKVKVIKGAEIKIGLSSLSAEVLNALAPGLSGVQKRELTKVFKQLTQEMKDGQGPFGLTKLQQKIIKSDEIKENTRGPLLSWLGNLFSLNVFSAVDKPPINQIAV